MINKKLDYRHYIGILITLVFIAFGVFVFKNALGRLIESVRDLVLSTLYYFAELLDINHNITPTVNTLPKIPFFAKPSVPDSPSVPVLPSVPLPGDYTGFKSKWAQYWQLWASADNFFLYLIFIVNIFYVISQIFLIIIPFIFAAVILFKRYLKAENNNYNIDSRPLKLFKKLSGVTYHPAKAWAVRFIAFLKENDFYLKLWACIWALHFNLITIIIEFIAFYLYFIISFDLLSIYRQVYKLVLDLVPMLSFVPVIAWVIIGLLIAHKLRKAKGDKNLRKMESENVDFIKERSIVIMIVGTMGKGKTKLGTDIGLTQEVMFRNHAYDMLLNIDLKFPDFPWINLENTIKHSMRKHSIFNLTTCRKFIRHLNACFDIRYRKTEIKNRGLSYSAVFKSCRRHLKRRYGYNFDNSFIFDYDFKRYSTDYDDNLKVAKIWDVLSDYAQLYFVYIIQSSLIISNYSIRTDNIKIDLGNFPLWDTDFFSRNAKEMQQTSRNSHIIDFDALRLGCKLVADNPNKDFFEFGVINLTEVGKERGNMLDNRGKKKDTQEANQINDLFNIALKMIRHPSTIEYKPFVKVITDEQRPESWGADARDLTEIIRIRDVSEDKLALPGFFIEELIYSFTSSHFESMYTTYRHYRGDNTLLMYLIKKLVSKFHNYYKRTYNKYGYSKMTLQLEAGTFEGKITESNYNLISKKIYSNRYATDCYQSYYEEKVSRSLVGIEDIPTYDSYKATMDEFKQQNSYFINDLTRIRDELDE